MSFLREKDKQNILDFLQEMQKSPLGSILWGENGSLYQEILTKFPLFFEKTITFKNIKDIITNNAYRTLDEFFRDLKVIENNCKIIEKNADEIGETSYKVIDIKLFSTIPWFIQKKDKKTDAKIRF